MPATKLKEFLDSQNIKYVTISHSSAFTAQEVAASAHIPGKELAKTVVIKFGGKLAMAVLPASYRVDLELLKQVTGAPDADVASEQEFKGLFPECETGAMPPFGNLYQMDVFVDQRLREDESIAFNAGSHTELIRMSYRDFERLVNPITLRFSASPHVEARVSGA
jgi:Ala-tRNA(Pro) deacylase